MGLPKGRGLTYRALAVTLAFSIVLGRMLIADQPSPPLPAEGEWDGVTEKVKLDRPYEDPKEAFITAGLSSYFFQPWRAYMDTHPASQFTGSMAFVANNSPETMDAIMQVMSESGIRKVRYECGWGNFDWNNQLTGVHRDGVLAFLGLCKKYHIRPLMLLNSHHANPCPTKDVGVQFVADAKKGDRTFKVRPEDVAKIHVGYTGPMKTDEYCSAKPLIIAVQADGTCQLSGPLGQDMKAGGENLRELKYLPIHGVKLKGADDKTNAEEAASDQAMLDGWKGFVSGICDVAIEGLGTKGQADAGFDLEVWNELTFGSNFLDINNYYDPKLEFTDPLTYKTTRPPGPNIRPDAPTEFKTDGFGVLLALTVEYVRSRPELTKVEVDNGLGNQWPWNGGQDAWPGEDAYSRHYYQGNWLDVSPKTVNRPDIDTINALGQRDGKRNNPPKDWYDIVPGSNFIPTTQLGMPEFAHCGFRFETLVRDVLPDSRWGNDPLHHGRFTHNGDFRLQHLWETEVNDGRGEFFDDFFKKTNVAHDDPRAYVIDSYMTGKITLRQYIFHNHKGLRNLYIFSSGDGPYNINMFEPPFFKALADSKGQLTDAVRHEVPSYFQGLAWLTKQMDAADPLASTRALRVDELWEYKPRLMYAGDGTPAHPHQWNRDWFAFLPYQLTAKKFVIPYYVVTVNAFKTWQIKKDLFDPMRYQMPDEDFEVTVGNCAGKGAKVSVYDPMTNVAVPVSLVDGKCSATQLTVRLKTVDYPRFLLVEEAAPGPIIQSPKVVTDEKGNLGISWKTNIAVDHAKVTYGKDWPNRGANEKVVPVSPRNDYNVNVPIGAKGVLAARISVAANGLTCAWPRWDEDVQGQVVVPGSVPSDVQPLNFMNAAADTSKAAATAVPLAADSSVTLPVEKISRDYAYKIELPKGVVFTGAADDQEASLNNASLPVHLRIRYLSGGNRNSIDSSLPFVAVGDDVRKTSVKMSSGKIATLVDMSFMPALHPELGDNLAQKVLLIPSGRDDGDLLVLAAEGMPAAMKSEDATISSIFASCQALQ